MSGAVSFVLGLLGLGASGAVSAGQAISQQKKKDELAEMYGWNETDVEVKKMRERVRKEWWSIPDCHPNCLGKWPQDYPDHLGPYYQTKFWFRDHLKAKGIPYDDVILNDVCGVNYEKLLKKRLDDAVHGRNRRRWF